MGSGQFGVRKRITEPSAVAPDVGVYFSDNCRHRRNHLSMKLLSVLFRVISWIVFMSLIDAVHFSTAW